MPGFFDMDWNDPNTQRLLGGLAGMAAGFGKAAMPSSLPIGTGAALSMGAEGMYQGMRSGQGFNLETQGKQTDNTAKAVELDRSLLIENLLRKSLGKPELSAADFAKNAGQVRSPLFGLPTLSPQGAAPGAEGAPAAPDAAAAPGPGEQQALGGGDPTGMGQSLIMKMLFGAQPTDYAKAKMYADMLPPGPEKEDALRAAAKLSGIDVTINQNQGEATRVWNPTTRQYELVARNPNLSPNMEVKDGRVQLMPGAAEAMGQVKDIESTAHFKGVKKEESFKNFLQTGGLGMGTESGDVKQQPVTPNMEYAQRVAQLESGGQADATNGRSTATGQHQFLQGTWLEQAKKVLPADYLKGKSDQDILALRNDPEVSSAITNAYAADNARHMQGEGIKNIGPAELYMAHHFGPDGATQLLKAPANTPIEQIMSPEVMKANPELAGMTVSDIYSSARGAMKGIGGGSAPQAQPQAAPAGKNSSGKTRIPPVSEAAPIPQGEVYLKTRIPQWAEQEEHWAQSLPASTVAEQRALAIAEALKTTQSGHWAEEKAKVAARLKAIGLDVGKESWFGDPAAVQTVLKDNFAATLEQIKAFTSRPAAVEVQLASQNFANPNLQPEANLKIIAQAVGTMRWDRQMMQDWAEAKKQGWQDPQDFQRAWIKRNPVQGYIDAVSKEIGPLKGMPGANNGKPKPEVQKLITSASIKATAEKYGKTVDEVKADLRANGYEVPN